MANKVNRSALLKTSTANDVLRSGGTVSITGLRSFRDKDILNMIQLKYRAETVQVIAVGGGSYTPVGGTRYAVQLQDPAFGIVGNVLNTPKVYAYTTPVDVTTLGATAALQREAIHAALVTKINAQTSRNYVVALSLGTGTGFSLTDSTGYYPARTNGANSGRTGATIVKALTNSDGSGWTSTQISTTTSAIYGFGVGARLLQDTPVYGNMTGNLVGGEIDAPVASDGTFALSGQKYDAYAINHVGFSDLPQPIGALQGLKAWTQFVFVDNGTGSDTTNAAGAVAFERAMLRLLFGQYANDPNSMIDFFDNGLIASHTYPSTGAVETTTDNVVMAAYSGANVWYINPQSTHTLITPIIATNSTTLTNGLQLILDATDEEGLELSAPNHLNSPKQFVVGKQEFSIYARITAVDFRHLEEFSVGFREKTADAGTILSYAASLAAYDAAGVDFAVLGNATEAVSGLQRIMTSLEAAGVVSTSTAVTYTTNVTHDFEVRVDINGKAWFYLDGVDKTSKQTTAFVFDAGSVVMPFIITALDANVDAAPLLTQIAVIPTINWRI